MIFNKNNPLLAQYTLLEPSVIQPNPNTASGTPIGLGLYLSGIYVTMYIIVAVGAVLVLVFWGIGYMLSDVPSFKGIAKGRIEKVLWGIGIALLSFLLLELINPDLVKFDAIDSILHVIR